MKRRKLLLASFALASILLLMAVWRYEAAAVAAVAGAFALITQVLQMTGGG